MDINILCVVIVSIGRDYDVMTDLLIGGEVILPTRLVNGIPPSFIYNSTLFRKVLPTDYGMIGGAGVNLFNAVYTNKPIDRFTFWVKIADYWVTLTT